MGRILIIGTGPAAAAVALAYSRNGRDQVEMIDVGMRLEPETQARLDSLNGIDPSDWPAEAATLKLPPEPEVPGELPKKKIFGSDFPFRDVGQLTGMSFISGGNRYPVSGAFGGFSNVWGSQVLPFSRATIAQWPIGYDDLLGHYRTILEHIPFTGADDDYSELFPLLREPEPLPPLAPSVARALARYEASRARVRRRGVTLAAARLAMRASRCIECGLCLTGCPYGLIYSASQTIDELVSRGSVSHTAGLLAVALGEDEQGPWARARDIRTDEVKTLRADRIFVACGGLGTTRLVTGSARPGLLALTMAESVQLVLPFVSMRSQPDPRARSTFTLNQLNVLVQYGRPGLDMAHFHLYPYNPGFDDALPGPVRKWPRLETEVLRRTVAALGYLPSWASPAIRLDLSPAAPDRLPAVAISAERNPRMRQALLQTFTRLLQVAPALDLWPVLAALSISGPGKSYHFGGSFPHVAGTPRPGKPETDTLGRLAEWRRIHLVDGSVFPSVPATTFTLTVMANAHRIATNVLREPHD